MLHSSTGYSPPTGMDDLDSIVLDNNIDLDSIVVDNNRDG